MTKKTFDLETALGRDIRTGVGDPRSRYFGQLLSEEDEKRLGADDEVIATHELWSKAQTDLYLTIGVSRNAPASKAVLGGQVIPSSVAVVDLPNKCSLRICTSHGKPEILYGTRQHPFMGASLELPSDLGRDEAKRAYVSEWITNTFQEAITGQGLEWNGGPETASAIQWVVVASQRAIEAAKL